MSLADGLRGLTRVFLDTAPLIYYVESSQPFAALVDPLADRLEQGSIVGVTSPITLAESLVVPFQNSSDLYRQIFFDLITAGPGIEFAPTTELIAQRAAEIRARSGLKLLDAIQAATAISTGCEAIVTNDRVFLRVPKMAVLLVQ